jgi:uncharacterized protein YqjF (DUF2071 family)
MDGVRESPGRTSSKPTMFPLDHLHHRPYPLPKPPHRLTQRWNDLLFAHWPIAPAAMRPLVPAALDLDLFDGFAWAGVVPFWMDRVRTRSLGTHTFSVPSVESFPELNLRTYVRSRVTGLRGVFFFSLDAASLLAVLGARTLFHLPYFYARMHRETRIGPDGRATVDYTSHRLFTRSPVRFDAAYRSLGAPVAPSQPGSLEHFLTERYCLFTPRGRGIAVGHIHHLPWPLEPAEADIRRNDIPAVHGIVLPTRAPILHFARELEVYLWPIRQDIAVDR